MTETNKKTPKDKQQEIYNDFDIHKYTNRERETSRDRKKLTKLRKTGRESQIEEGRRKRVF